MCQMLRMVTIEIVINSTRVMGVRVAISCLYCIAFEVMPLFLVVVVVTLAFVADKLVARLADTYVAAVSIKTCLVITTCHRRLIIVTLVNVCTHTTQHNTTLQSSLSTRIAFLFFFSKLHARK